MQENSPLLSKNSEVLGDPAAIASKLGAYHVADAVDALNALAPAVAASALESMPVDKATDILVRRSASRHFPSAIRTRAAPSIRSSGTIDPVVRTGIVGVSADECRQHHDDGIRQHACNLDG
jgi:hypothetical protein